MDPSNFNYNGLLYDASGEQVDCWLHHQNLDPSGDPQFISLKFMLEHADIGLVVKSIELLFRRHESLRSFFKVVEGEVMQCVMPYSNEIFSPSHYDICNERDIEGAISGIVRAAVGCLRELGRPPLLRCSIIRCSEKDLRVVLVIHHIISDDWSKKVIERELVYLYETLQSGIVVEMSPARRQLKDYVDWQKEWLKENESFSHQYWHEKLSKVDGTFLFNRLLEQNAFLHPSIDREGLVRRSEEDLLKAVGEAETGHYIYHIDGVYYDRLCRFSVYCNNSISAILNSSIQLLFFLIAGRKPILIATPFASRYFPGAETIIGYLVGIVYLHQEIDEDLAIKELIKKAYFDFLNSCMLPIFNHSKMKFPLTLRLYTDISVNYESSDFSSDENLNIHENKGHYIDKPSQYYGLIFSLSKFRDGLSCRWAYNTGVYSLEMIDYILERHRELLGLMMENPDITVRQLLCKI